MRVMVTGGYGMVGRNVRAALSAQGIETLSPSRRELDLLDFTGVSAYIRHHQPEFVIHCAGRVGGIHANMANPVDFLLENLNMGQHVIMASRQAGVRQLINLGSSCMYPKDMSGLLSEEMLLSAPLEPTNEGYALAKLVCARLCAFISEEPGGYLYKTLIPCNLYGPWDKFDPEVSHLLPAIVHKVSEAVRLNEETVEIWGDGTARREFLYAGDLADCIVHALSHFESMPQTMNVGPGTDETINHYYHAVAKEWGFTGRFVHNLERPVGMHRKLMNVEKAAAWGWRAKTTLEEGISKTVAFYRDEVSGQLLGGNRAH